MFKRWLQINLAGLFAMLLVQAMKWINPDISFLVHPWRMMVVFSFGTTVVLLIMKILLKYRKEWFEDDKNHRR